MSLSCPNDQAKMSTTSSEGKADGYDSARRGSETAEEADEDTINVNDDGGDDDDIERERKRRRVSSSRHAREMEREVRMERYAKARIREIDAAKKSGVEESSSKTQKRRSRDNSRSRASVPASRSRSKSPAMSNVNVQPSRVGKRLRRRPQRWEGAAERKEQKVMRTAASASARSRDVDLATRESDGEQTVSETSMPCEPEVPVIENPIAEMRKAVSRCGSEFSRRTIVDSFHTWQLQAVSRQAAQQKALHVYLKRKLRKRTARAPELDRLEDEALRNARTATVKAKSGDKEGEDDEVEDEEIEKAGDDDDDTKFVPSKLRLPLEAYLPRRVRANKIPIAPNDALKLIAPQPHLPGETDQVEDTDKRWMEMKTVSTFSLLNKQKNGSKQKTARSLHAM